jgi:hypothetical protein
MRLLVLLVLTGCGTAATGTTTDAGSTADADAGTTTPDAGLVTIPADADLDMQASDFECLRKWTSARGFYITNKLGYLNNTLAVADSPDGGVYPVGTVVQLIPQEAMVKRKTGWNTMTHDWEFFRLNPTSTGTTITVRGGAEVVNGFNGTSCFNCHDMAQPQWDLICETTHGCAPLGVGPSIITQIQQSDPRCH